LDHPGTIEVEAKASIVNDALSGPSVNHELFLVGKTFYASLICEFAHLMDRELIGIFAKNEPRPWVHEPNATDPQRQGYDVT
jgi:hypothetical protein